MPVDASLVLASAADAAEGRLGLLGAGRVTTSPAQRFVVVAVIYSPGAGPNRHEVAVRLVDRRGQPVVVPTRDGLCALAAGAGFELDACDAASVRAVPLAFEFGPTAIPPGSYRWELTVDGVHEPGWTVPMIRVSDSSVSPPRSERANGTAPPPAASQRA